MRMPMRQTTSDIRGGADGVCPDQALLDDFVHGRLSEPEWQGLAAHLTECPYCEETLLTCSEAANGRLVLASAPSDADKYGMESAFHEGIEAAKALIDGTVGEVIATPPFPGASPTGLRQIGRFELREQLGAGGFGVVYRAYDPVLKREVALKLPHVAATLRPEWRERLLREAEAAAGLHHPNIVPVFELGEADGVCYLAMALCRGPSLATWLKKQIVDPDTAVRMLLPLAEAVDYAHQHGVLHRDIKPQNVLLDPAPDGRGLRITPRLTDFGLAKLFHADEPLTATGLLLGTPQYMAPEQAEGQSKSIGPHTDVYALGAVLYELLTGRPPVVGSDPTDTLRRLLLEEPVPLRKLVPSVACDLEAIVHKCLERSPQRRYVSAAQLAEDLRRYLAGTATLARPLSRRERLRRWVVRHPAPAGLIGTVIVAGVAVVALLSVHNSRLSALNTDLTALNDRLGEALGEKEQALAEKDSARAGALRSEHRTRELLYASDMIVAERAWNIHDLAEASRLLDRHVPGEGQSDLRGFEWYLMHRRRWAPQQTVLKSVGSVHCVCHSPDGRTIAAAGEHGTIFLIDAATGEARGTLPVGTALYGLAFSPDASRLAAAGANGTLRLFDLQTAREVLAIPAHPGGGRRVTFDRSGDSLISCGAGPVIRVWDAGTGEPTSTLKGHQDFVCAIAVSPDGKRLASGSQDRTARIWDLQTGEPVYVLKPHHDGVTCLAFSSDGTLVATGSRGQFVRVWSTATGHEIAAEIDLQRVRCLAFVPGTSGVVFGDESGTLHYWDFQRPASRLSSENRLRRRRWTGHRGPVTSLTASPDGRHVLSAGEDGRVILSAPFDSDVVRGTLLDEHPIQDIAFVPHSRALVTAGVDGIFVREWSDHQTDRTITQDDRHWSRIAVSPDGAWLAAAETGGQLQLWRLYSDEGSESTAATRHVGRGVRRLVFSPDSARLAVAGPGKETRVEILDVPGLNLISHAEAEACSDCVFSPDGQHLLVSSSVESVTDRQQVLVWHAATREIERLPHEHEGRIRDIDVSPTGRWAAIAASDRAVVLQDLRSGGRHRLSTAQTGEATAVAFSPDGRTLATGGMTGALQLWHVETAQFLFAILQNRGYIERVAFSDDSRCLACLTGSGRVFVFDTHVSAAAASETGN